MVHPESITSSQMLITVWLNMTTIRFFWPGTFIALHGFHYSQETIVNANESKSYLRQFLTPITEYHFRITQNKN